MWRSNIRVEISSEKYKWVYQMKRNKWREKMHVPNINGSYRVCFILSLWNLFTDLDILCEKGFNTTLFQTEVIKD